MADVQPLHTLRYDPAAVGSLDAVAAPPYDVIDAPLRAELPRRARSTSSRSTCREAERRRPLPARADHDGGVAPAGRRGARARARDVGDDAGLHGPRRRRADTRRGFFAACAWRTTARAGSARTSAPSRARRRTGCGSRAPRARTSPPSSASSPTPTSAAGRRSSAATDAEPFARSPTPTARSTGSGAIADPEAIAAVQAALADARAADRRRPPPLRDRARLRRGGRRRGRAQLRADVPLLARRTRACTIFPTHRLLTGPEGRQSKQLALRDAIERALRRRARSTPTSSSRRPTAGVEFGYMDSLPQAAATG